MDMNYEQSCHHLVNLTEYFFALLMILSIHAKYSGIVPSPGLYGFAIIKSSIE